MTAAWVALGFCGCMVLLYIVVKLIRAIEDTRDTLEEVLDAVLTPSGEHVWTTPLPAELAVWDAEVEAHLNGGDR